MPKAARYYLARVHKMGHMNVEEAIRKVPQIWRRPFNYTFLDVFPEPLLSGGARFVYAKLAKYRDEGSVGVVNSETHRTDNEEVENLLESYSDFVYIHEYAAIAYRNVIGQIEKDKFPNLFCKLCEEAYSGLMVSCELDPITDLRTFVKRISQMTKVDFLSASVSPPNPLFGPLWEDLKDYLKSRGISKMTVLEKGEGAGITTNIVQVAAEMSAAEPPGNTEALTRAKELMGIKMGAIGDVALLMAADGYGKAKVEGHEGEHRVIIKTSDNQKSFLLDQDATPEEIYEAANNVLSEINLERGLGH